jgi:MinD-like ATPase involved in chromosome partitioning or flagellar assembly
MADQTSHEPVWIVRDILVRLQDQYILTDFIIIDMGPNFLGDRSYIPLMLNCI